MLHCLPNDPKIIDMNDIMYNYLYASWIEQINDEYDKMKRFGCFVGSFWNSQMAKHILDSENNQNSRETDDKDFEQAWQMVREYKQDTKKKHKKVKLIKNKS